MHKEDVWYCFVHMGWWDDVEESFQEEWDRLEALLKGKTGNVWIIGDFNSPVEVQGEGHDYVKSRRTIWDGKYYPVVSEHYGVMIEVD